MHHHSGDPPARRLRRSSEAGIGTAFVLLLQLRVLVVGATVLIDERVRDDVRALGVLGLAALVSGLVLAAWERVMPRLFERPALLACDVLVGYAVLEVGGIVGPYFLITVVAAGLAGLLYRWPVTALLCAQQTVLFYVALFGSDEARSGGAFPLLVAMPAFYVIGAVVGAVLRRLLAEHAAAEEAAWRSAAAALAAGERSRLAREMHDSLTGTLSGIALSASGLVTWVHKSPDRAESEARRLATATQVALRDARALITELREDAVQLPLDEAIRRIAADWERSTGIPVTAHIPDAVDLPVRSRYETVAIVKEALENVRRHAGATRVVIHLAGARGGLEVSVRDDGRGLPAPSADDSWLDALAGKGHYGLVGMHERARRAGGELIVESGRGTGITVRVPRPPGRAAAAAAGRGRR